MVKSFANVEAYKGHLYAKIHTFDYFLELCKLCDDELNLDTNRFSNFSSELLPEMTEIILEAPKGKIEDWFLSSLNSVSVNNENKWSIMIEDIPKSRLKFKWYFEDKNDALLFKLAN